MEHDLSSPDQWLTLHGDILYRYALTRVRDIEIAEDLVQETLLAALMAKNNYAGQATEQTWLIGILKHKIIDYFRKTSREHAQQYNDAFTSENDNDYFDHQGHWQVDLSHWSKPEQSMQHEQFFKVLQDCIDRMPKRMAQLFIMREFDNMESNEICDLMSISSMNNFWVMQSRIRMQLRQCLDIHWLKQ